MLTCILPMIAKVYMCRDTPVDIVYICIINIYLSVYSIIYMLIIYTGLDDSVMERCFTGTSSRIKGADFNSIYTDMESLHRYVV